MNNATHATREKRRVVRSTPGSIAAPRAARLIEQKRERRQAAHPDARAQEVRHGDGLRPYALRARGQVARAPEENESERRQQKSFASGGDPVSLAGYFAAQKQKGGQHDQETKARQP